MRINSDHPGLQEQKKDMQRGIMILSIGEILVDIFTSYERIGGAPFNFAYHMKKFGFPTRFISRIGHDEKGEKINRFISESGFDTGDVQIDTDHPTGRVHVQLNEKGIPDFEIVPDVAYDHLSFDTLTENFKERPPELVYFGSLIQRTPQSFKNLHDMFSKLSDQTTYLYDMNLRPGVANMSLLNQSLKTADILKLNEEELHVTATMMGITADESEIVDILMADFGLKLVAVTGGEKGSSLYMGGEKYKITAPETDIVDTVGAGDAYCALLAVGYLSQWPPEKILAEANRFSALICQIPGAIPSSDSFYRLS